MVTLQFFDHLTGLRRVGILKATQSAAQSLFGLFIVLRPRLGLGKQPQVFPWTRRSESLRDVCVVFRRFREALPDDFPAACIMESELPCRLNWPGFCRV